MKALQSERPPKPQHPTSMDVKVSRVQSSKTCVEASDMSQFYQCDGFRELEPLTQSLQRVGLLTPWTVVEAARHFS